MWAPRLPRTARPATATPSRCPSALRPAEARQHPRSRTTAYPAVPGRLSSPRSGWRHRSATGRCHTVPATPPATRSASRHDRTLGYSQQGRRAKPTSATARRQSSPRMSPRPRNRHSRRAPQRRTPSENPNPVKERPLARSGCRPGVAAGHGYRLVTNGCRSERLSVRSAVGHGYPLARTAVGLGHPAGHERSPAPNGRPRRTVARLERLLANGCRPRMVVCGNGRLWGRLPGEVAGAAELHERHLSGGMVLCRSRWCGRGPGFAVTGRFGPAAAFRPGRNACLAWWLTVLLVAVPSRLSNGPRPAHRWAFRNAGR
ncbi:hypothetical protein SAMN05421541_107132 [Actinoplanes philippinensis]|uniref:Uncharacterized protein n=1 Tax=Actinoplanes philippinensis TaxID=35752 RepID=A0A1I2GS41_9ACTN|nr:hypothetical protein SAMN05421541_107132 [Actinoplanes philippinensis]